MVHIVFYIIACSVLPGDQAVPLGICWFLACMLDTSSSS